jgi:hypothetical protein
MAMVADAPLGLDLAGGVGCLPLEEEAVRATYARLELHVPSAIRALTGREPSAPRPVDVDAAWRPSPHRTHMRFPPLPRAPEPASVQETLF